MLSVADPVPAHRSQRRPQSRHQAVSPGDPWGLSWDASPQGHGYRAKGPISPFPQQPVVMASEENILFTSSFKAPGWGANTVTLRSDVLDHIPVLCSGPVVLMEGFWNSIFWCCLSAGWTVDGSAAVAPAWGENLCPRLAPLPLPQGEPRCQPIHLLSDILWHRDYKRRRRIHTWRFPKAARRKITTVYWAVTIYQAPFMDHFIQFILTRVQRGSYYHYAHFTEGETKAQRS